MTGRYVLHGAKDQRTLLARHENGIFNEARAKLANIHSGHRSHDFDIHILPRCGQSVEAIGHRMAYEAAKCSGIDHIILDFFEISCVADSPAWYIENTGLTCSEVAERQATALENVLPLLPQFLDDSDVEDYVTAPIVDEGDTEKYILGLPTFEHHGKAKL